jgi:hypothetical protein
MGHLLIVLDTPYSRLELMIESFKHVTEPPYMKAFPASDERMHI